MPNPFPRYNPNVIKNSFAEGLEQDARQREQEEERNRSQNVLLAILASMAGMDSGEMQNMIPGYKPSEDNNDRRDFSGEQKIRSLIR